MTGRGTVSAIESLIDIEGSRSIRVWLMDVWGVLYDGATVSEFFLEQCRQFRLSGGLVILLTNSSRSAKSVLSELSLSGMPAGTVDACVTAGDVARASLPRSSTYYVIGDNSDLKDFSEFRLITDPGNDPAAVICCRPPVEQDRSDVMSILSKFARSNILFWCLNPDLRVLNRGQREVSAGAIAELYKAMGGRVKYFGKPHCSIYKYSIEIAENIVGESIERDDCLAVGDGFHTDVLGASRFGISSILVPSCMDFEGTWSTEDIYSKCRDLNIFPSHVLLRQ